MSAAELLSDLQGRGVSLWHADGRLRFRGPREAVDLATLKEHRDALLELLRPPVDTEGLPTGPCPVCGGGYFWRDREAWTCEECQRPEGYPKATLSVPRRGFRVISETR